MVDMAARSPSAWRPDGSRSASSRTNVTAEEVPMDIVINWDHGPPPSEGEIIARMHEDGLNPHGWGNAPGDTYGWHEHHYELA